jgi:hypothetical protein
MPSSSRVCFWEDWLRPVTYLASDKPFTLYLYIPSTGPVWHARTFRSLKMKALHSFETWGTDYSVMLHHIAEEWNPQQLYCDNLKTCKFSAIL